VTSQLLSDEFLSAMATAASSRFRTYQEIRLEFEIYGATVSWTEMAQTAEGAWVSIDFSDAAPLDRRALKSDKAASYTKGRGTWFAARLTLVPDEEPRFERFETEPLERAPGALQMPVPPAAVQAELALFPREQEWIPGWMRDILESNGLDVPYLDPATEELVLGSERAPFQDPAQ